MRQFPYWGCTNISCHRTKLVTQETWRPRLCTFASTTNMNSVHILYSTHNRELGFFHILAINTPYTMCRLQRMFSQFVYQTKVTLARHFCTRHILRKPLYLYHMSVFPSHKTRNIQDSFLRLLCWPNMCAGYNLYFKFTVWYLCRS